MPLDSPDKPALKDVDGAELIALVAVAFAQSPSEETSGESAEAFLTRVSNLIRSPKWVVDAAQSLQPSLRHWLERPWHCWQLRKLLAQWQGASASGDSGRRLEELARIASMVQFGVPVGSKWYRKLLGAVRSERISGPALRSLLRSSCVWWGTDLKADSGDAAWTQSVRRIWHMGRPAAGELAIRGPTLITVALLSLSLMLLCSAAAFGLFGAALHAWDRGTLMGASHLLSMFVMFGPVAWALWFVGPKSWISSRRLLELWPELGYQAATFPAPQSGSTGGPRIAPVQQATIHETCPSEDLDTWVLSPNTLEKLRRIQASEIQMPIDSPEMLARRERQLQAQLVSMEVKGEFLQRIGQEAAIIGLLVPLFAQWAGLTGWPMRALIVLLPFSLLFCLWALFKGMRLRQNASEGLSELRSRP